MPSEFPHRARGGRRLAARAMLEAAFLAAALFLPAGSSPARAADSVTLFAELARPALRPAELAWQSARATGPKSLVLEGVVLTPFAAARGPLPPLRVARVTIDDIDFESLRHGDAPSFLRARLEGISASPASLMLPPEVGAALGPGPFRANLAIDYRVRGGEELHLARLSLDIAGLGRLEAALDLGGLAARGGRFRLPTIAALTLRSGRVVYDDRSLLERLVAATARSQHASENLVIVEWSAVLGLAALKEGTPALPLLNTLLAFLKDYRAPKGPLRISFAAPAGEPGGLPLGQALGVGFFAALGPQASYAGAQ